MRFGVSTSLWEGALSVSFALLYAFANRGTPGLGSISKASESNCPQNKSKLTDARALLLVVFPAWGSARALLEQNASSTGSGSAYVKMDKRICVSLGPTLYVKQIYKVMGVFSVSAFILKPWNSVRAKNSVLSLPPKSSLISRVYWFIFGNIC